MFAVNQTVTTEYGNGTVIASSGRRVAIRLETGDIINVATGTPGYNRVQPLTHYVLGHGAKCGATNGQLVWGMHKVTCPKCR